MKATVMGSNLAKEKDVISGAVLEIWHCVNLTSRVFHNLSKSYQAVETKAQIWPQFGCGYPGKKANYKIIFKEQTKRCNIK